MTEALRSMTGYALVRQQTSAGELTVSLRSVNHRGLDLQFHQSAELAQFENEMRAVLKQHVRRGHVEVRSSLAREGTGAPASYNRTLLTRYLEAFRRAAAEHGLTGAPDLNAALSLPGMWNGEVETASLDSSFAVEVVKAVTRCVQELNAHREREARDLQAGFEQEIEQLQENTLAIAAIRREAMTLFQHRLTQKLGELLGQSGISESRLIEEAALLTERSDIDEELTRSRVHATELRDVLQAGGEVGKRIDFLLQEMNRETNTILSKTSGIGEVGLTVSNLALANKAHIEKIREQALNLE